MLSLCAWESLKVFLQEVIPEKNPVPGAVIAIQTFGDFLMVYYLRRKDGTMEIESSGTLVERDGTSRHLRLAELETTVLSYWKSNKSAGRYPAAWRIRVDSAAIDVTVNPLVAGQELITTSSTSITYWEGAVAGKGTSQGKEAAVEGYVELTGYAGTLGGIF